jgi:phosphoribosyl 1,2-cyclic phosphate phosphodiesterase
MDAIRRAFPYVFDGEEKKTNVPHVEPRLLDGSPFDLFGLEFLPIPILHGPQTIYGFRFGNAAYLTDHSEIPASSMELLRGLDVIFLDALRYKPHPTHSTVERSIKPSRPSASAALSSPISATIWATNAPKACCRRTSAWHTTGWKS